MQQNELTLECAKVRAGPGVTCPGRCLIHNKKLQRLLRGWKRESCRSQVVQTAFNAMITSSPSYCAWDPLGLAAFPRERGRVSADGQMMSGSSTCLIHVPGPSDRSPMVRPETGSNNPQLTAWPGGCWLRIRGFFNLL